MCIRDSIGIDAGGSPAQVPPRAQLTVATTFQAQLEVVHHDGSEVLEGLAIVGSERSRLPVHDAQRAQVVPIAGTQGDPCVPAMGTTWARCASWTGSRERSDPTIARPSKTSLPS